MRLKEELWMTNREGDRKEKRRGKKQSRRALGHGVLLPPLFVLD